MHRVRPSFVPQAMAPVKPKTFSVALNTTFFDCARYVQIECRHIVKPTCTCTYMYV